MLYELRTYETFNHNKRAFHERFEKHAMRIKQNYGFKMGGSWAEVIVEMPNFTSVLEWQDLNTRQDAWAKFNSDKEWTKIKVESAKEHGRLVSKTRNKILKPTPYSPLR